jgi:hypothetical protein
VAVQLFLIDLIDGIEGIPRRAGFDPVAGDIEPELLVRPPDFADGIGQDVTDEVADETDPGGDR